MTMNKIMAVLRRYNKGQYRLVGICVFLSVLLVTSFSIMYFSPTVQTLLPEGGDTRKLALLMLGVTIIGCTVFTVYGANLFFKYKSHDFGVFLALGETKSRLAKCLAVELAAVISKYTLLGLICSVPASFLIWKLFLAIIINSESLKYQLDFTGIALGILFACFLILCIFAAGVRFIKRANIIDILNDQRKTEMVRAIKPWTGKLGIALIITGLVLAMAVPSLTASLLLFSMPSVWNVTYLISVAGLYLLMLSAVGHSKKGKQPEKYYKNIISTSLMRFTARQTTKNMCVITMLVFVLLLSAFWAVMYYNSAFSGSDLAPADYSLHYPLSEEQVTKEDIYKLAKEHNVDITSCEDVIALQLIITYEERDLKDDGKYVDETREKSASFISASDFARISGKQIALNTGEYATIVTSGYKRTIWVGPDCLKRIESPDGREAAAPVYKGTAAYDNLAAASEPFTFILSDADYQKYVPLLDAGEMERVLLFNVKDVYNTYDFAVDLNKEFINRSSEKMDYTINYDPWQEKLAHEKGEEYTNDEKIGLYEGNTDLLLYWKYAPFFKVLTKANAMQLVAVFVLLSVYIAIISLASAGVMSYVRSITIAVDNRQLFDDLKKLGADKAYIHRVIRTQLNKIFSYPVIAGSSIVSVFALLLTYFNDMRLQPFEVKMLAMILGLIAVLSVYMYVIYKISFRKMEKIVE